MLLYMTMFNILELYKSHSLLVLFIERKVNLIN